MRVLVDFDVRAIAREELARSDDPDPQSVALAVKQRIPPPEYGAVIEALLPYLLRELGRNPVTGGEAIEDATPTTGPPAVGPSFWERRRRAWSIERRVSLDEKGEEDRWLSEMTWADVCRRRDLLDRKASQTAAERDRWDSLQALMVAQGAHVVGDLSEAQVKGRLGL